ncbi:MAG: hypothetical protein M1457_07545 [bacterium]|nr:hypothetical protein [bacterium]
MMKRIDVLRDWRALCGLGGVAALAMACTLGGSTELADSALGATGHAAGGTLSSTRAVRAHNAYLAPRAAPAPPAPAGSIYYPDGDVYYAPSTGTWTWREDGRVRQHRDEARPYRPGERRVVLVTADTPREAQTQSTPMYHPDH